MSTLPHCGKDTDVLACVLGVLISVQCFLERTNGGPGDGDLISRWLRFVGRHIPEEESIK